MPAPAASHSKLYLWLSRHPWACWLLMTLAFVGFGLLSLDLVRLVSANAGYLSRGGWEALREDGLLQLVELCLNALIAIAAYVFFKLCEQVLVQRLARGRHST